MKPCMESHYAIWEECGIVLNIVVLNVTTEIKHLKNLFVNSFLTSTDRQLKFFGGHSG